MKTIKGATAKARFKTLLARHREWESKSAKKSGDDERETDYIRAMTELWSSVGDFEAKIAQEAAAKEGEQRTKVQSGEVVRQAAVARIHLGKRRFGGSEVADETEDGRPSPIQLRPSTCTKGASEWITMFEESNKERSKAFGEFLQQQQSDLKLRLDFEREERQKDRADRERERAERQLERNERQQERAMQAKLIERLLDGLDRKTD